MASKLLVKTIKAEGLVTRVRISVWHVLALSSTPGSIVL